MPSALEAACRCQQSRGFRAGHSFHRRRSLFARGQHQCLLSRRYSIYKRYRHRERTPGKRRVLPFRYEILPEVKEVKLPYPYFTGFRACARQPSSRLWITSPYGTLLRGIHRAGGRSHTDCLLTERTDHAFMSLSDAPSCTLCPARSRAQHSSVHRFVHRHLRIFGVLSPIIGVCTFSLFPLVRLPAVRSFRWMRIPRAPTRAREHRGMVPHPPPLFGEFFTSNPSPRRSLPARTRSSIFCAPTA